MPREYDKIVDMESTVPELDEQDPLLKLSKSLYCKRCGEILTLTHTCLRANIKPSLENLLKDVTSLTDQISECWDGEVEVFVMLVPKDKLNIPEISAEMHAPYGTTIPKEKLISLLRVVIARAAHSVDIRRKLL